ncbi:MAG: hypothetical protein AAF490_27605, partial [Chloroflexota bacterium]
STAQVLIGDLTQAESNVEMSLKMAEKMNDSRGMAFAYLGLGRIARYKNDVAIAQDSFKKSLTIFDEIRLTLGKAWPQLELGKIAAQNGELKIGLVLLESALTIFEEANDQAGIAYAHLAFAMLAIEANQLSEAETHLRSGLQTAVSLNRLPLICDSLWLYVQFLDGTSNHQQILEICACLSQQTAVSYQTQRKVASFIKENEHRLPDNQQSPVALANAILHG